MSEEVQDEPLDITEIGTVPLDRVDAFSDAVFAIAITLLVLELSVPPESETHLLHAVANQWPSYLAYVTSFSSIGTVWLAHTYVTTRMKHATPGFIRLNLVLLMVTSFLPFPTRLLAEYLHSRSAERVASTIYGLTLMVIAFMVATLWRYALTRGLLDDEHSQEENALITRRLQPALVGFVVMLAVGLVVPRLAVVGYLFIAVSELVPLGKRRRQGKVRRAVRMPGS